MASQKPATSGHSEEIDGVELEKEVHQLELLARRSEARLRRLEADSRLREMMAKKRSDAT